MMHCIQSEGMWYRALIPIFLSYHHPWLLRVTLWSQFRCKKDASIWKVLYIVSIWVLYIYIYLLYICFILLFQNWIDISLQPIPVLLSTPSPGCVCLAPTFVSRMPEIVYQSFPRIQRDSTNLVPRSSCSLMIGSTWLQSSADYLQKFLNDTGPMKFTLKPSKTPVLHSTRDPKLQILLPWSGVGWPTAPVDQPWSTVGILNMLQQTHLQTCVQTHVRPLSAAGLH